MRATYRLQLHAGFTFADAAAIVPYLAELGISHLYLSPILQAAAGSTHGYDVVDPHRVNAELGGEDGFLALAATAKEAGLAILLDIVPNHMSIGSDQNRWWLDVLENGPSSYYAHFFDVDWGHGGDDRVLLPILTERYGRALTSGALASPTTARVACTSAPAATTCRSRRARSAPSCGAPASGSAMSSSRSSATRSPICRRRASAGPRARRRRHRDKGVLAHRLAELCADAACARALDDEIAALNADAIELDAALETQNYRLAHWGVSASQVSYRRFFDISSLVGMRVEEPDVFSALHARVLTWVADGTVAGLRVDHVDGLRDPEAYLTTLRRHAPVIVVEKILSEGEHLPPWPVDGTTGYDTIALLSGLFVDPAGEDTLTHMFETATGEPWDVPAMRRAARREVLSDTLHGEVARLTELAARACGASPACRDYTRGEIETTLVEILAGYPVYRTYGRPEDADVIARAVDAAAAAQPDLDRDLLAFLGEALSLQHGNADARELALQTQQVTGAVVAKGDEDTLAYRAVRLLARDEVGADPATFAIPPATAARRRSHAAAASTPRRRTTTKRGEDVRARIRRAVRGPTRVGRTRWCAGDRARSATGISRPIARSSSSRGRPWWARGRSRSSAHRRIYARPRARRAGGRRGAGPTRPTRSRSGAGSTACTRTAS